MNQQRNGPAAQSLAANGLNGRSLPVNRPGSPAAMMTKAFAGAPKPPVFVPPVVFHPRVGNAIPSAPPSLPQRLIAPPVYRPNAARATQLTPNTLPPPVYRPQQKIQSEFHATRTKTLVARVAVQAPNPARSFCQSSQPAMRQPNTASIQQSASPMRSPTFRGFVQAMPGRTAAITRPAFPFSAIQMKSEAAIKQELRDGQPWASNFTVAFIGKHLGSSGTNTNVSACQIHAARNNPPRRNTVIMDAGAFKRSIRLGIWTDQGDDRWRVVSYGNVTLQVTRKRNDDIEAPPALVLLPGIRSEPEHFTVTGGTVTAVTGVTNAELTQAITTVGAYPTRGQGARLRTQRRDWRSNIIANVNTQRNTAYQDALLDWIRANFSRIGATNIRHDTSRAAIDGIARIARQVTVEIDDDGDIDHLVGTT
jgi:hypothetical protein